MCVWGGVVLCCVVLCWTRQNEESCCIKCGASKVKIVLCCVAVLRCVWLILGEDRCITVSTVMLDKAPVMNTNKDRRSNSGLQSKGQSSTPSG